MDAGRKENFMKFFSGRGIQEKRVVWPIFWKVLKGRGLVLFIFV